MLKKGFIFLISIYFYLCFAAFSDQKENIINQINAVSSLEFTFQQEIDEKVEKGDCLLEFPGKLKCNYYDNKQKEIIINNGNLAITQKRYDKTNFYPISKSPFLNILYKDRFSEIIKSGTLKTSKDYLELIYSTKDKIIIFFNKNSFELSGWKIIDQYNNEINFNLKIVARNSIFSEDTFKLPLIN